MTYEDLFAAPLSSRRASHCQMNGIMDYVDGTCELVPF